MDDIGGVGGVKRVRKQPDALLRGSNHFPSGGSSGIALCTKTEGGIVLG